MTSPESGVRGGSLWMSRRTSRISLASRSRMVSCRIFIKPPMWQICEWSTEKEWPQTHVDGRSLRGHMYLINTASRNSVFVRMTSWRRSGKAVTNAEAPFSWAIDRARRISGVSCCRTCSALTASAEVMSFLMDILLWRCSVVWIDVKSVLLLNDKSLKTFVTF